MQYKDLKEMTIKEWDGQPFMAYVCDNDDTEVKESNVVQVCGYINRPYPWWSGVVSYKHVYPVEWNRDKVEESSKPKRMTYRQLSKWLAKGNGVLWKSECNHIEFTSHNYVTKYADTEVMDNWKVRKWDSEEWVEPTIELLED